MKEFEEVRKFGYFGLFLFVSRFFRIIFLVSEGIIVFSVSIIGGMRVWRFFCGDCRAYSISYEKD